jgi:hypothetical protein
MGHSFWVKQRWFWFFGENMIDSVWVAVMIRCNLVFFQEVIVIYVPYCCICYVEARVSKLFIPFEAMYILEIGNNLACKLILGSLKARN